jgi:hypothetical protein
MESEQPAESDEFCVTLGLLAQALEVAPRFIRPMAMRPVRPAQTADLARAAQADPALARLHLPRLDVPAPAFSQRSFAQPVWRPRPRLNGPAMQPAPPREHETT